MDGFSSNDMQNPAILAQFGILIGVTQGSKLSEGKNVDEAQDISSKAVP